MASPHLPGNTDAGRHARPAEVRSPGRASALRRVMLALAVMAPPVWSHLKLQFAIVAPVVSAALLIGGVAELAAPRTRNAAVFALLGAAFAVLVVWIMAVAVPLLTKGKLPDGRYLAEVLARRRSLLRQRARVRRQAFRHRRD